MHRHVAGFERAKRSYPRRFEQAGARAIREGAKLGPDVDEHATPLSYVFKRLGHVRNRLERAHTAETLCPIRSTAPAHDTERSLDRLDDPRVKLAVFSRRFGQPAATMAGIALSRGAACVVIDVDLQDPPELIRELHAKMREGFDVVYAKRRSREGETLPKRLVAFDGYKLIARLSDVEIPRDTGDFRIMSQRVVEELKRLGEGHGFLRGLVAYVGFPQAHVLYDRDPRHSGAGNYNRFFGSIKIGLNGIVSFGGRPLQLMSMAGFLVAGFSFLLGAWYVLQKLLGVDLTAGLPTTVLVVTFFSGVQLLSLGLMGEYVSRIYDEVKRRPMYIIDRRVNLP
jgi:dolichol-phosphate mannosyltransferase